MKNVIGKLKKQEKSISTMESCTGGALASAITDVEGASDVIKYSAVTYSNEFKIKMGVNEEIINKYSVYSSNVANEMSFNISKYTNSNYGVGITGKLNRVDKNNLYGENNVVFISIYDKDNDKFYNEEIKVTNKTRYQNKKLVIKKVIEMLNKLL